MNIQSMDVIALQDGLFGYLAPRPPPRAPRTVLVFLYRGLPMEYNLHTIAARLTPRARVQQVSPDRDLHDKDEAGSRYCYQP